ncbi:MAG TPA: sigma-70 family RNA polymerase sigma factor [Terriglobales bacterium]|nr:sigma-70 family RNA polymerase sigma factor [Terriglobales bacterium]
MTLGPAPSTSEAQLLRECRTGNRERFQLLVAPYLRNMQFLSYSILKNQHDVEEVVQESILKAFTHVGQLREGESFRAWLLQIAGNEARMRLRKERKHLYDSVEEDFTEGFYPRQFVNWRDIPSAELERKELRLAVAAALACLDDVYREVFILRDVQHLSALETGRILGLSEGAVNTRLHRARLQLREHLTPLFRLPRPMSLSMPLKMMLLMGKTWMRKSINCRQATSQISRYIDGQLTPDLREKIEEHLKLCERCSVVVDTTRKLLYIAGDEKVFSMPFECKVDWQKIVNRGTPAKGSPA